MRIEINAGGLGGAVISGFQFDMTGFITSSDSVISAFKAVKSETYNLSGGVGALQGALDGISSRIQSEDDSKAHAEYVQSQSEEFLALVSTVDSDVASNVDKNKEELYKVNSWLKPAVSEDEKAWYEKALDWVGDRWDDVKSGAKKIWKSVSNFYQEHKYDIINITVAALCVVGSAIVIALVPGASLLLLACVSAASSAIIAGTRNATSQLEAGGELQWGSFFKDVGVAALVGGATGALGGWISNGLTSAFQATSLGSTLLNSSSSFVRMGAGTLVGGVSETGAGIVTRAAGEIIEETFNGDLNWENVGAEAFDKDKMAFDAILGGVSGGWHARDAVVGKKISDPKELKNLDKPYRSPNANKWIKNGGEIYVDANNTWTYVDSDGTKVVYSKGVPDFNRAHLYKNKYKVDGGFNTANHNIDINKAIEATGMGKDDGYTWHHLADGKTLVLIKTTIHKRFTHIGGFAIAKRSAV